MPTDPAIDERLRIFVQYLAPLTSEERLFVLDGLRNAFCIHCGDAQPDGRQCQCWNDE